MRRGAWLYRTRRSRLIRILLDHNAPAPLRYALPGHQVETTYERGWATLLNGDLISQAEEEGFELLITTDRGIRHQQNWANRNLAMLILSTNDWTQLRKYKDRILAAVNAIERSAIAEVEIPTREKYTPSSES